MGGEDLLQKVFWIALAGSLGTLARYGFSGWVQRAGGAEFPWGTLAVNVGGCFLFGLIWSLAEHRWPVPGEVRTIVLLGFLGAFTTFSSFAFETAQLMRDFQFIKAAANIAAQNFFGLAGLYFGLAFGRMV